MRPFAWDSLPRVSRDELAAGRALRAHARAHVKPDAVAHALGALLGAPVTVTVRRVHAEATATATPLDDGIAVILGPADGPAELAEGIAVEVEGALAVTLASRALRRPPPAVVERGRGVPGSVAGAVAAVLAAALRRVHATRPLRIVSAGPSAVLLRDMLARAAGTAVAASLSVEVDGESFLARVVVAAGALSRAPVEAWDDDALRALGALPLAMPVVAAASISDVAEVAALRPGDVWIPAAWTLEAAAPSRLAGPTLLAAPDAEYGVSARIGEDGRLIFVGDVEPLSWSPDDRAAEPEGEPSAMSNTERNAPIIDAVGDIPVVVRVEIGAVQMRAREWANLSRGDVVALGRRVGDAVVLRIGGVEAARGELVDIEGELGVRILDRQGGKESAQ